MIVVERLEFTAGKPAWEEIETIFGTRDGQKLYALLDGAMDESLLPRIEKHWPVDRWQSIYAQLPEGDTPEVSPLLIPIDPQTNPSSATVFRRLLLPSIVKPESLLFLWSDASLAELAEHLGQYAAIRTSDDKRALLRFHDPNILPAMLAVQTESEQRHFFSRIAEIWRPDLDLNWWSYRIDSQQHTPDFVQVQWDEARHRRFASLIEPRKVLQRLEEEYEEKLTGSREAWLKKLGTWIEQAEKLKANAPSEHYLYCVTALFTSERFHETPEVAEELSAIGLRHANFIAAIQAVSPEVWERLESLSQGQMIQAY